MIADETTTKVLQRDTELKDIETALKRAALKARELAKKNGTEVVYIKDGQIHNERVT